MEASRDLAAAGHLEVVLIYSPDRLSRKYAYQVLLVEELYRCGVELVFLNSPAGATPEDQLVLQFQGMIAEYEPAQIAERLAAANVTAPTPRVDQRALRRPLRLPLCCRSDTAAAYYEVIESEAAVVRCVYVAYTQQGLSINAIAHRLNDEKIPTRTGTTLWEIHRVEHAAQTGLSGAGVLWEDRTASAVTHHPRCANARAWRAVIAPTTSGLGQIGSRFRFRP